MFQSTKRKRVNQITASSPPWKKVKINEISPDDIKQKQKQQIQQNQQKQTKTNPLWLPNELDQGRQYTSHIKQKDYFDKFTFGNPEKLKTDIWNTQLIIKFSQKQKRQAQQRLKDLPTNDQDYAKINGAIQHYNQDIKKRREKVLKLKESLKQLQKELPKKIEYEELLRKKYEEQTKAIEKQKQQLKTIEDQQITSYQDSSVSESQKEVKPFQFDLKPKKILKKYKTMSTKRGLLYDSNSIYDKSLRKYCRPSLINHFKKLKQKQLNLQEKIKTKEERLLFELGRDALQFYSHIGDYYINHYLRNNKEWKSQHMAPSKIIDHQRELSLTFQEIKSTAIKSIMYLDQFFNKFGQTFSEPVHLYRGSSLAGLNLSFFKSVQLKGYVSCTSSTNIARSFSNNNATKVDTLNLFKTWHQNDPRIPILNDLPGDLKCCFMHLFVEQGIPMILLNYWNAGSYPPESEVLLPHSLYFTLCSVYTNYNLNEKRISRKSTETNSALLRVCVLVTKKPIYNS